MNKLRIEGYRIEGWMVVCALSLFLMGCGTTPFSAPNQGDTASALKQSRTVGVEPTQVLAGQSFRGVSNKTMRFISRQQLFQIGCTAQSENYNDQRISVALAPPIVLERNERTGSLDLVSLPAEYQTKLYNQAVAPFDMIGCLAQASKTAWERTANKLISFLGNVGVKAIKYGTGYAVAKEGFEYLNNRDSSQAALITTATQNAQPRVEGDNNRVVVGDNNEYNEAGGIQTEPLTFAEAQLSAPTVEPEVFNCVEVRAVLATDGDSLDANGDGLVCSDGMGGAADN